MLVCGLMFAPGAGSLGGLGARATFGQTTTASPYAGDPAGATTGKASDIATAGATATADDAKAIAAATGPGMQFLADSVGQDRIGLNMAWLLICGFLVMFMQAGFALVETGFTRAKSATHTMMMNFTVYFLGMLGFWAVGFGLMYGAAGPIGALGGMAPFSDSTAKFNIENFGSLFATKGFFLAGDSYDVAVCAMFLFQVVFMDTAVTIPTGAMAERWKFTAFIPYCFFVSMFLYPLFGHWAWGGGWLSQLGNNFGLGAGYVDFAGSGVVHTVGGMCGLAGAMVLGPRLGKYNRDGSANAIPGHNICLALTGVMILGFGWFGFNAGSTFGAAGGGNLRIGTVATTTMLASAGGGAISMLYMYLTTKKPDPTMVGNGFLGGLVAITAPCAFVSPSMGVLIGAIGGLIVCWAVAFLDNIHVDDPIGAVAVHAGAGLWGVFAVGIFADGTYGAGWNATVNSTGAGVPVIGLLYGGTGQFWAQLIGAVTAAVWGFGASYAFFKIQSALTRGGIRSSVEDELGGLDIPDMGIVAYPPAEAEPEYIPDAPAQTPAPAALF
ncbi:MAG TPA: ammonium transporter [Abditibacteriaceae bacterium]